MKQKRVMFIASTGGHLNELMQLKPMFNQYDYTIVTEKTKSTISLKNEYHNRIYYLIYGTKDHMLTYPFKLLINCFISLFIYIKEHPKYIVTTGTHSAGPMCLIGKIFGSKIIFIETFANRKSQTATGKILYKYSDLFIVQWPSMVHLYPKAKYGGWIY